VDKILKFLQKTEIITRNWLQNQDEIEEKGVDKKVKEGEE
jgi:predicted HTH transcriptional regulator